MQLFLSCAALAAAATLCLAGTIHQNESWPTRPRSLRQVALHIPRSNQTGSRIVGGHNSPVHDWMISLGTPIWATDDEGYMAVDAAGNPIELGWAHYCGGSLIAPRWVLTAAHCIDPNYILYDQVRLGFTDLAQSDRFEKIDIQKYFIHPGWETNTFTNDIALLYLARPSTKTPVVINQATGNAYEGLSGFNYSVIGWGATSEGGSAAALLQRVSARGGGRGGGGTDSLLQVYLPPQPLTLCQNIFDNVLASQMCVGAKEGGRDACQGDSGGPLFYGLMPDVATQVGIVSFGAGCARPGFPGVYTRISSYIAWIKGLGVTLATPRAAVYGPQTTTTTTTMRPTSTTNQLVMVSAASNPTLVDSGLVKSAAQPATPTPTTTTTRLTTTTTTTKPTTTTTTTTKPTTTTTTTTKPTTTTTTTTKPTTTTTTTTTKPTTTTTTTTKPTTTTTTTTKPTTTTTTTKPTTTTTTTKPTTIAIATTTTTTTTTRPTTTTVKIMQAAPTTTKTTTRRTTTTSARRTTTTSARRTTTTSARRTTTKTTTRRTTTTSARRTTTTTRRRRK